jgi:hypothetical protein
VSFREKGAWISFFVILLSFGIYFGSIALDLLRSSFVPARSLVSLLPLVVGIVVLETVLHVFLAVCEPASASAPRDERERLIELKAVRPAFFVLIAGALLSIGGATLGAGAWPIVLGVLFSVWIAELTRFGMQLCGYRCGA